MYSKWSDIHHVKLIEVEHIQQLMKIQNFKLFFFNNMIRWGKSIVTVIADHYSDEDCLLPLHCGGLRPLHFDQSKFHCILKYRTRSWSFWRILTPFNSKLPNTSNIVSYSVQMTIMADNGWQHQMYQANISVKGRFLSNQKLRCSLTQYYIYIVFQTFIKLYSRIDWNLENTK